MTNKRLNLKKIESEYYELNDTEKTEMIERVKLLVKRKKNFITEMMNIVEKKVKHYKADFYIHDIQKLHKSPENSLIWIIRDSGTHYIDLDSPVAYSDDTSANMDYFQTLVKMNRIIGFYLVDRKENTLQKIKQEKAEAIIKTEFEKAKKHYSQFSDVS
ncbi:MAG: hypothetical protein N2A99_06550 [Carnobacterium alterfunditum]